MGTRQVLTIVESNKLAGYSMRVLQLISSSGFFGAENVLLELAKELNHTNISAIVGVFNNQNNPHLELAQEAKRHNLPTAIFPCRGRFDLKAFLLLRKFLNDEKIDIIHTHNYKSSFYALFASVGLNIPLITTCHNWLGKDPRMRFYTFLDKVLLKKFDRVVAVSETIKCEILNHAVPYARVVTIYNGININKFGSHVDTEAVRREFGIKKDCKIVGTVGRISEEKGHVHLLRAAEKIVGQHHKTVFIIVGDGPLKEELRKKFPLPAIIFTGTRTDLAEIYSLMDIFILPSLTEGLPLALLEAMASRKPVIATNVGAVSKVVTNGETGVLIEPGREDQIIDAIAYLLKNEGKAREMGENGCLRVKSDFSSQRMAQEYIEIYRTALQGRG